MGEKKTRGEQQNIQATSEAPGLAISVMNDEAWVNRKLQRVMVRKPALGAAVCKAMHKYLTQSYSKTCGHAISLNTQALERTKMP